MHVIGGFAPVFDKANVLKQLLALGAEFDVPVLIHAEFSRPNSMLSVCEAFPDTQIVWAHSGALLESADVDSVLALCEQPVDGRAGYVAAGVEGIVSEVPGAFYHEFRSDPVWPVDQLDRWDEADSGWQELGRFWSFHRNWLAQLPPAVVRKIGCENAVALFGRPKSVSCD